MTKAKKALGVAGKAIAATTAAAGVAFGKLAKDAVSAYANYEQLVGGVETLFGAGGKSLEEYAAAEGKTVDEVSAKYKQLMQAQKLVMDNAAEAYKTAGLSANEYMDAAIGFSGALLKSLGGDTVQAAEQTQMAISDMADQANKYGKTVEEVSVTYTSLARGNFQTLDNLFGGMFAGTKAGLSEMLQYAERYRASIGETVDYSSDSYADIVSAIHDVSVATGVYGTTAQEAAKTISGSLAAMKSAWQNLVTGIADENANVDKLIGNFVESAETAAKNVLPRIEKVLEGFGKLVEGLAPVIAEALPNLVKSTLPSIVKAAVAMLESFVAVLGNKDSVKSLVDAAVEIVLTLADALIDNIETIIGAVVNIITAIVEKLMEPETLKKLIEAAIKITLAIAKGIIKAIPDLLASLGKVIENILYAIGKWEYGLFEKGKEIVQSIADGIAEAAKAAAQWGRDLIDNFVQGIKDRIQKVVDAVKSVAQKVKDFLGFSEPKDGPLSDFHTYAPDMMRLFAEGVRKNTGILTSQIAKSFDFGEQIATMPRMYTPKKASRYTPFAAPAQQTAAFTINIDGNAAYRGILPAQQLAESMRGVGLIG